MLRLSYLHKWAHLVDAFQAKEKEKTLKNGMPFFLFLSLLLVRFFPLSEGDLDRFPLAWFARRSQGGWMVYGSEKKKFTAFSSPSIWV